MFGRLSTGIVVFLSVLLIVTGNVSQAAYKMPDPIVLTTLDVGGGGYVMGAAISAAMKKYKNVTMRVLPCGTDISRMSVVRMGRAHVAAMGMGLYLAQEGAFDFGTRAWGPQPIRMVLTNWAKSYSTYITAKDANIKTWADAKGKRFAVIPGLPAAKMVGTAMLAFGGLTWDDVVKVECPSFGAAAKAIVNGKVDATVGQSYSSFCYELEASPRGVYYPPTPHDDKAAWKRLLNVAPYYVRMMCTVGAGLSKAKPLEGASYPNNNLIVYDDANPDLVYNVLKLYVDLYPEYVKSKAPGIQGYSLDMVKNYLSWAVPFHEGAIRYFKERGLWTAENEANNKKLIERQRLLQTAWDETLAQSADQKIKEKDFTKFWMTRRQKALEKAGLPVIYYP